MIESSLKNKVVWVTGASSGIGEAFVLALASTGARIAITARREERLAEIVAAGANSPSEFLVATGDVTNRDQMHSTHARIVERFGPVDVLIANAGNHVPTDVVQFSAEHVEDLFKVNFFGAINCLEMVLPSMIERSSGYIVGVSSVAGYRGLPKAAAYGSTKAALTNFLEALRFDLEPHGIDVSVVSPGFVKTPLTDKNDFPMPFLMEVAEAAACMLKGVEQRRMEVHFPKKFTFLMKMFRILPYPIYHWLVGRVTKSESTD